MQLILQYNVSRELPFFIHCTDEMFQADFHAILWVKLPSMENNANQPKYIQRIEKHNDIAGLVIFIMNIIFYGTVDIDSSRNVFASFSFYLIIFKLGEQVN